MVINEIAWAGTLASAYDEWIELRNRTAAPIDLGGWLLLIQARQVPLQGVVPPGGFYLLERTDDSTIADILADCIYTGGLNNGGGSVHLLDPTGARIDSADFPGGWPAGDAPSRASMQRTEAGSWVTFAGPAGNGLDAAGNPIRGTPRRANRTSSPAPSPTRTPYAAATLWINEIAWAGTLASANDEWIELYNPGPQPVDLNGWTLTDDGDLRVPLSGFIPAVGFFLLERTDDSTIDDIPANQIYTGSLNNGGDQLRLVDPSGSLIDRVDGSGGWPAGDANLRASMQRFNSGVWLTFSGAGANGHDAGGAPIRGTPGRVNVRPPLPPQHPAPAPARIVINEILVRPHYDWEGHGGVNSEDEFIELFNAGTHPVSLGGWKLDDLALAGSRPYTLPNITLQPGEYRAFFKRRTHVSLNDGGDSVRLLGPDGSVVEEISYLRIGVYNLSVGRLPDGTGPLRYGLWPTPGTPNEPFDELDPADIYRAAQEHWNSALLARLSRNQRYPSPGCWTFSFTASAFEAAFMQPLAGSFLPPPSSSPPAPSIRINEIAWSGTRASPYDEWIELRNLEYTPVDLRGWKLFLAEDRWIGLRGTVPAHGYILLERSNENTLPTLRADLIYIGALQDRGAHLLLISPDGTLVDEVNFSAGWPSQKWASVERCGSDPEAWSAYPLEYGPAHDALGHPVLGSPARPNWCRSAPPSLHGLQP
jgi:hypothetical protein